ncbi:MAG: exodeoxyribonuclease V subunit gamma [Rubricoccaceae bacterium]
MPAARLTVITASRLEPLRDRLAETMRDHPLAPLERETVVVARNVGLRRYLERELAWALGVAASLDLVSPRDLTSSLAKHLIPSGTPDDFRTHPFEAAALAWRIRDLLEIHRDDPVYTRVRIYLDRAAERGEAGLPLAARLAELFDTYQVYRPEALAAWARGERLRPDWSDEAWQADLWQRLTDEDSTRARGIDRATHLTRLIDRLETSEGFALPVSRVSVFGALVFPPLYWRVLGALARHIPVTIYAVAYGLAEEVYAPTEAFAHPLLQDLGGRTREWMDVLREIGEPPVERIASSMGASRGPTASSSAPPDSSGTRSARSRPRNLSPSRVRGTDGSPLSAAMGDSSGGALPSARAGETALLHRLQHALATDASPTPESASPSDRSIRVLDCHSPLRELEVLRDEILDAFDHISDLTPGDVGVLVSDLGTYAPLIDAVFGAESIGSTRIPYHVAEHPQAPELRVLDAFHRILALDGGRATVSEVVGLLDVPSVRQRAGIREDELATLLDWVRDARVHWGRDGAHKAAFGMGEDDVHTWRFGLDRLLVGYAVGPGTGLVLDRLPVAEVSLDGADLLGRFTSWTETLFGRLESFRAHRTPSEWADALLLFVDDVFEPRTEPELAALVALRRALDAVTTLGESDVPASFGHVRQHLASALSSPERAEPFLTGKVTFADPLALRHAPFRVLAMVGLGDAFPRTEARPDFDLMGIAPERGDPDTHGTDQQVFLDAVMAARERLVLSYVGRSHMDNSERAASVALDSLLDVCRRMVSDEHADRLVVRHALQPFSPSYFTHTSSKGTRSKDASPQGDGASPTPTHFTYAHHHAPPLLSAPPADGLRFFEAPDLDLTDDTDAPTEPVETTLDELARAWTNPSRYHCAHLGLTLRLDEATLEDDEPVVLDGLAFHGVKSLVLHGLLTGEAEEDIIARLIRSGQLPPGVLGEVYVSRAFAAVRDLADRIEAHGLTEPVPLRVESDVWTVDGTVMASTAGVLRFRPASVKGKDLIKGWIDHLALCAVDSSPARTTTVLGEGGGSVFQDIPEDQARAVLQFLVRGMLLFRHVPPPLFEKASYEQARAQRGKWAETHEKVVAAESSGWRPVRVGRSVAADGTDDPPFIQRDALKMYDGRYEDFSDTTDPAVALCYRRREPLREMAGSFDRWSRMLWGPLLAHREDA